MKYDEKGGQCYTRGWQMDSGKGKKRSRKRAEGSNAKGSVGGGREERGGDMAGNKGIRDSSSDTMNEDLEREQKANVTILPKDQRVLPIKAVSFS